MGIRVKFEKHLQNFVPQCDANGWLEMQAEQGLDIASLLDNFSGVKDRVAIVIINGCQAGFNDPVKDGDRISLFSLVSGG